MPPRRPASETQKLDKTVELLDRRYGLGTLKHARDLPVAATPPHISTGFDALDALTGAKGLPLGHISLLAGRTTSGKLSVAYRALAHAQGNRKHKEDVAVIDCTRTSDADYIARCGVDLAHTLFVRPPEPEKAIALIFDLLQGYGLQALLIDGLGDLLKNRRIVHGFDAALPQIASALRQSRCALICLDEPAPPWLRFMRLGSAAISHAAGLHLEFKRERWHHDAAGEVRGYVSSVRLVKSRWIRGTGQCELGLELEAHP
jgi:hypothetical protein